MRIPAFLIEHPGEAVLAGLLLLALVFGSADRHAAEAAQANPVPGPALGATMPAPARM